MAKEASVARDVKHFVSDANIMAANFEKHFKKLREQIVQLSTLNVENFIDCLAVDTSQLCACIGWSI